MTQDNVIYLDNAHEFFDERHFLDMEELQIRIKNTVEFEVKAAPTPFQKGLAKQRVHQAIRSMVRLIPNEGE